MTVIAEQRFDTLTSGSAVTLSSPWSVGGTGTTPTAQSTAAIHGAIGCHWASASGKYVEYSYGTAFTTAQVFSNYFNIKTMTSNTMSLASVSDGASWNDSIQLNANHTVTLVCDDSKTSTATLAANTAYRLEWKLDPAGDTQEARFYAGEGTTPLFTLSSAWTRTGPQYMSWGPSPTGAAGNVFDLDTIKVATDWTGPDVGGGGSTPRLVVRRYNGTVWE